MRPVILLDIDGVAANFIAGCLPYVFAITGREHQHDDVNQFMIEKALGLDDDQTKRLYEHICREGWCRSLPPYEEAKAGVVALREFADVVPVTAHFFTSKHWVSERDEWIVEHLGIPKTDVVHTHAKFRITGDALVDDKISHLIKWKQHHPSGRAVLFQRKYNQNDGYVGGEVVGEWPALVAYFEDVFGVRAGAVPVGSSER